MKTQDSCLFYMKQHSFLQSGFSFLPRQFFSLSHETGLARLKTLLPQPAKCWLEFQASATTFGFFFFRLNQRFKSDLTNWPRLFTFKYFPPNLVITLSLKSVTPTCYLNLFAHQFALLESIHTDQRSFPSHAFCSPQIAGNSHLQTVKQPYIIILYLGGTNLDIA